MKEYLLIKEFGSYYCGFPSKEHDMGVELTNTTKDYVVYEHVTIRAYDVQFNRS